MDFGHASNDQPKIAFPVGIIPRPTDRFLLKAVLAVQHGEMPPEELESLTEEPELPDDVTDAELALLRVYDACGHLPDDPPRAREVAEEALALDPGCPDALVLLWSLESEASDEALRLAREAQESAEARIEQLPHYRRGIDDLWRHEPGCRGLVRAHVALAQSLWARDERYDAIGMAERVISLNPMDNTGLRWRLSHWYLMQNAVGKAYRLLREYAGEPFGPALSAAALVEFLRSGAGDDARKALMKLAEHNASLLMSITHDERPDACPSDIDMFVPGEISETVVWRRLVHDTWQVHPEAVAWAKEVMREPEVLEMCLGTIFGLAEVVGRQTGASGLDAIQDLLGEIDPPTGIGH